jgi:hypothetical protein
MQLSHDVQLLILGALIGGVFSLLAALAGAHHEDWVGARRKQKEDKETLEKINEMKELMKAEVLQEVLAIIERSENSEGKSKSPQPSEE